MGQVKDMTHDSKYHALRLHQIIIFSFFNKSLKYSKATRTYFLYTLISFFYFKGFIFPFFFLLKTHILPEGYTVSESSVLLFLPPHLVSGGSSVAVRC